MNVISDNGHLLIKKEDTVQLDFGFTADEFVIMLHDETFIPSDVDPVFYANLEWFMRQDYAFGHPYSHKEDDELVWLSDQSCDLEDEESVNRVNRLILLKQPEGFLWKVKNPFLESMGISRQSYFVIFSPGGNGHYARNTKSGSTLQNDMVSVFQYTMNHQRIQKGKVFEKRRDSHGD